MMDDDAELKRRFGHLFEARYVFTSSGFADIELDPKLENLDDYSDYHRALLIFSKLIINKDWAKLDGPCSRCGKYFVRERKFLRKKKNVFCTRECSSAGSAAETMQRQRDEEYAEKLARARAAGRRWRSSLEISFKEFVHKETGLTLTWIQRAMNQRDKSKKLTGGKNVKH
jgi:hypothetical protein